MFVCVPFFSTVLGCRVCEVMCDDACWILCVLWCLCFFLFYVLMRFVCEFMCDVVWPGVVCFVALCDCVFPNVCECIVCDVLGAMWLFILLVCSFNGIVRFVFGVLCDVLWLAFVLCVCGCAFLFKMCVFRLRFIV